jgi:hypothetical protein
MLLVRGLPPVGAIGGRVGLIAIDPAPEAVPFAAAEEIPPPGPLYEWPEDEGALASLPHSKGISRRSDDVKSGSKLATLSSDSTTGLKGGVICLLARRFQSMDLKKGCSLSSAASRSAPSRCFGFRFKSCKGSTTSHYRLHAVLTPLTNCLPSSPITPRGNRILPKQIFLYICCTSSE